MGLFGEEDCVHTLGGWRSWPAADHRFNGSVSQHKWRVVQKSNRTADALFMIFAVLTDVNMQFLYGNAPCGSRVKPLIRFLFHVTKSSSMIPWWNSVIHPRVTSPSHLLPLSPAGLLVTRPYHGHIAAGYFLLRRTLLRPVFSERIRVDGRSGARSCMCRQQTRGSLKWRLLFKPR